MNNKFAKLAFVRFHKDRSTEGELMSMSLCIGGDDRGLCFGFQLRGYNHGKPFVCIRVLTYGIYFGLNPQTWNYEHKWPRMCSSGAILLSKVLYEAKEESDDA